MPNYENGQPVRTTEEALNFIEQYEESPEDFSLPIPIRLLDNAGVAMAMITDRILAKG